MAALCFAREPGKGAAMSIVAAMPRLPTKRDEVEQPMPVPDPEYDVARTAALASSARWRDTVATNLNGTYAPSAVDGPSQDVHRGYNHPLFAPAAMPCTARQFYAEQAEGGAKQPATVVGGSGATRTPQLVPWRTDVASSYRAPSSMPVASSWKRPETMAPPTRHDARLAPAPTTDVTSTRLAPLSQRGAVRRECVVEVPPTLPWSEVATRVRDAVVQRRPLRPDAGPGPTSFLTATTPQRALIEDAHRVLATIDPYAAPAMPLQVVGDEAAPQGVPRTPLRMGPSTTAPRPATFDEMASVVLADVEAQRRQEVRGEDGATAVVAESAGVYRDAVAAAPPRRRNDGIVPLGRAGTSMFARDVDRAAEARRAPEELMPASIEGFLASTTPGRVWIAMREVVRRRTLAKRGGPVSGAAPVPRSAPTDEERRTKEAADWEGRAPAPLLEGETLEGMTKASWRTAGGVSSEPGLEPVPTGAEERWFVTAESSSSQP